MYCEIDILILRIKGLPYISLSILEVKFRPFDLYILHSNCSRHATPSKKSKPIEMLNWYVEFELHKCTPPPKFYVNQMENGLQIIMAKIMNDLGII